MIKNLQLATLWGILLWMLIFAFVSIFMFTLPSLNTNLLLLLINPVLILLCGFMYFREVEGSVREGLILGLFWIMISIVLDAAITVPLFVKSYQFFFQWPLWVGNAEVLIFAVIAGRYLKAGKK